MAGRKHKGKRCVKVKGYTQKRKGKRVRVKGYKRC